MCVCLCDVCASGATTAKVWWCVMSVHQVQHLLRCGGAGEGIRWFKSGVRGVGRVYTKGEGADYNIQV